MKSSRILITLALSAAGLQSHAAPLSALQAVTVQSGSAHASILTTSNGLTLYTFDMDNSGQSACSGDCAEKWPPYTLANTELCVPPMGFITRAGGLFQATLNGKPLYTFNRDRIAGDTQGDKLGGVWHVVNVVNPVFRSENE